MIISKKFIFICFIICSVKITELNAQIHFIMDSSYKKNNYELKDKIYNNSFDKNYYLEINPSFPYPTGATSFLKPQGHPPVDSNYIFYFKNYDRISPEKCFEENENCPDFILEAIKQDNIEEIAESDNSYAEWLCKYCADKIVDGDLRTAWSEGVHGDGIGEIVITTNINVQKPIEIYAGYGKSESLYYANNRPKKVKIFVLFGKCAASAIDSYAYNIQVLSNHEIELKDINGFQPLFLPKFSIPKPNKDECDGLMPGVTTFIAIEIISVYKGTKYDDTLITEIRNVKIK